MADEDFTYQQKIEYLDRLIAQKQKAIKAMKRTGTGPVTEKACKRLQHSSDILGAIQEDLHRLQGLED